MATAAPAQWNKKNENKSIIKVHIKILSHIHAHTEAVENLYTEKTEKKNEYKINGIYILPGRERLSVVAIKSNSLRANR